MTNSLLEKVIRRMIAEDDSSLSSYSAAGFIVVRKDGDSVKVMGLKQDGGYDVPKGRKDPGESDPLLTAKREMREEANITDFEMPLGSDSITLRSLVMYFAVTDQKGKIRPNPKTGELEHEKIDWLTFDQLERSAHSYLVPAVVWARQRSEDLFSNAED